MINNEVLLEHLNLLFDKICPILHIEQADRAKFIAVALADCQKTQTSSVEIDPRYNPLPKAVQLCYVALGNLVGERDFPFISDSISDAFFTAVDNFTDHYMMPAPTNKTTVLKKVEYNALLNSWFNDFNKLLTNKIKTTEFRQMINSTYSLLTPPLGNSYEQKALLALCFYIALFHHFSADSKIITPAIFEKITKINHEALRQDLINLLSKNEPFTVELKKLLKTPLLPEGSSAYTRLEEQAAASILNIFTQPPKEISPIHFDNYPTSSSLQMPPTITTTPVWGIRSRHGFLRNAQSAFQRVAPQSNDEPKSKKAKTSSNSFSNN